MNRFFAATGLAALTLVAACSDQNAPTAPSSSADISIFSGTASVTSTVVVTPATLNGACQTVAAPYYCSVAFPTGWLFYNDERLIYGGEYGDPSLGSFVSGPATPANGIGSAQISVFGTQRRNLASYAFAGTPLASITALSFRTYNPAVGNPGPANRSAYLQFNVDFDGSDTWQRRLVFVPSQNGTVVQDSWQEWDALNGGNAMWSHSGPTWPGSLTPGTTLKTWSQILSEYPGVRIRVTDAQLSMRVGEPYLDGYTENIDSFTFGTAAGTTIYDFDPTPDLTCYFTTVGSTMTLNGDCETSTTILVPDGKTLDGAGNTITAVDPAGDHFRGAVIRNGGATANVTNLVVTASGLSDVCDLGADRLRGILFQGAAGTISNNTVQGVRQGLSGCQEGNAIEVRNEPFSTGGSDVSVAITGNTVSNYQKNGITANGSVVASITGNTVTGDGPITYTAQNGIQVGFGATATVKNNVVTGNNYTPVSYEACGLLFYQADGVKASANNVYNNEKNQCNVGKGGGNVRAAN